MQAVDFNSDMGEGFGPWTIGDGVDNELMGFISSANIATGFHAGDPGTMRRTVEHAKRLGVAIGAHPGFRDLVGFGRRHINAPAQELVDDMLYQLGALRELARVQGVALQHIKPHGALYMHLARDEEAARLLVENLQRLEPELLLYCMPDSVIWRVAKELGQPVIREFYADREYDLIDRVIELVAQSGTFSRPALTAALQLSDRKAARLTTELELLGIISRGADDAPREVFIQPYQLATFLANFRARRRAANHAA